MKRIKLGQRASTSTGKANQGVWRTIRDFGLVTAIVSCFLGITLISSPALRAAEADTVRTTLEVLYNATGGASWTNNSGWLGEPGTECTWYGVQCVDGNLHQLNLDSNNLVGTLPAELGNLTNLTHLFIGGNQLIGTLPESFAQLNNLIGIWAWGNQFSGALPPVLAQMTQLQYLHVGGNNFEGAIPAEFGNLVNLVELSLPYNLLTGQIPATLSNLVNASTVDLRNNLLSGDVPQSVLDLGVVNLWANVDLNIAKGDDQACVANTALNVGETAHGALTPFTDCHIADENAMVDFYQLDLSAAVGTTLLSIEGSSQHFWPRLGILGGAGTNDRDVAQAQMGESPFAIEVALAPGQYTLYIHGGVYNHDKHWNVPATGDYSLSVNAITELQADCRDFNNTWVTKGTEFNAALSSNDCLDDFNEPHRLFDSYAIWLEQGESVTVVLEAQIATQLLSFNESSFIAGTPVTAANTKHGLTVTASSSGWHRFAPYTTRDNPQETGTYTIRFLEPIVAGDTQACTENLPVIGLGDSVQGTLEAANDCFNQGRLSDRYVLNISEPTLFRANIQTDGFLPMLGVFRAEDAQNQLGGRIAISESLTLELYLAPGQYWLFASSRFTALDNAIEGAYTLSLSESLPISQMQTTGCVGGYTRLVLGGPLTVQGQITEQDCLDSSQSGESLGNPELDGFFLAVPTGSAPIQVNLTADFNTHFSISHSGNSIVNQSLSAGQSIAATLSEAGTYWFEVRGQQGSNAGTPDRGNYTLDFLPQVGDEQACTPAQIIRLGDTANGSLNRISDCFRNGRLTDRYLLELTETTLFRVEQSSEGFAPFTGIYPAGDDTRLLGSRLNYNHVYTEYLLPAGQYWIFASSWYTDGLAPPAGDYTLTLSAALPPSDIQTHPQFGPTRLIPQGTVLGELATTDNTEPFINDGETRYVDGYSFAVPAGQTVTATLEAGYPVQLSKWQGTNFSDLEFTQARLAEASEPVGFELIGPANYIMFVIGNADGVTGPYTLDFDNAINADGIRVILETLYNATDGDNWINNTGWLGEPDSECSWFGVTCDGDDIVGINLAGNGLSGSIPVALTELVTLLDLNLANNSLTGSVPAFRETVTVNVSNNPLSPMSGTQQVYMNASGYVFKGLFNNLPIIYDVSDADATLTGVGMHIHYDSSQISSIDFANILDANLLATDASGSADTNDLDGDPRTDRYITIGWSDASGNWPGSLPRKLFDLRVRLSDTMSADDQLVLNFSRTSNTTGYDLELPQLLLNVVTTTLDVDGNGDVEALTDGLMIIRSLFGFSGTTLIDRAIANDATVNTVSAIQQRLLEIDSVMDVDGNGTVEALTDGLMVMRYLFGFRGDVLTEDVIAGGATRTTAVEIEEYLEGLAP